MKPFKMVQNYYPPTHIFVILFWLRLEFYFPICLQIFHLPVLTIVLYILWNFFIYLIYFEIFSLDMFDCNSSAIILSSVQLLSRVWLFATPWIAARQASLSITISQSSLRLTSIESVMPSSHLILGRPLLLLPPIPPNIRVFSNESTPRMR